MRSPLRWVAGLLAAAFLLTGCLESEPSAQDEVRQNRQSAYEKLVALHGLESMDEYSPTLETIVEWTERWEVPGKLSYMYITNAEGDPIGYYVLKGLPVSYCTSGTPTYDFEHRDLGGSGGDIKVPAPAMDGAYYSGFECDRYYATEALTGRQLDWTKTDAQGQFVTDLPVADTHDIEPLFGGTTTIEEAEAAQDE